MVLSKPLPSLVFRFPAVKSGPWAQCFSISHAPCPRPSPRSGLTPLGRSLADTGKSVQDTLLGPPWSFRFGSFTGDLSTATKSKTSEDISQASKYSPAYSPDPYYAAESEYWTYHGSPKGSVPHRGAKARALSPAPGTRGARTVTHPFTHSFIHLANVLRASHQPEGDTGKHTGPGPCPRGGDVDPNWKGRGYTGGRGADDRGMLSSLEDDTNFSDAETRLP